MSLCTFAVVISSSIAISVITVLILRVYKVIIVDLNFSWVVVMTIDFNFLLFVFAVFFLVIVVSLIVDIEHVSHVLLRFLRLLWRLLSSWSVKLFLLHYCLAIELHVLEL